MSASSSSSSALASDLAAESISLLCFVPRLTLLDSNPGTAQSLPTILKEDTNFLLELCSEYLNDASPKLATRQTWEATDAETKATLISFKRLCRELNRQSTRRGWSPKTLETCSPEFLSFLQIGPAYLYKMAQTHIDSFMCMRIDGNLAPCLEKIRDECVAIHQVNQTALQPFMDLTDSGADIAEIKRHASAYTSKLRELAAKIEAKETDGSSMRTKRFGRFGYHKLHRQRSD